MQSILLEKLKIETAMTGSRDKCFNNYYAQAMCAYRICVAVLVGLIGSCSIYERLSSQLQFSISLHARDVSIPRFAWINSPKNFARIIIIYRSIYNRSISNQMRMQCETYEFYKFRHYEMSCLLLLSNIYSLYLFAYSLCSPFFKLLLLNIWDNNDHNL